MPDQQVVPPDVPSRIEPEPTSDTAKPRYSEPKLTFVKPELVPQGEFTDVTGQFFGTFTP